MCAVSPVPLSKVPGQVLPAFDYADGALEQGDRQFSGLSTDGGRASNAPEDSNEPEIVVVAEFSLSQELESDNQRTEHILPKTGSDSSESATPSIGRWRTSIPKSWKKKAAPQVTVERSTSA